MRRIDNRLTCTQAAAFLERAVVVWVLMFAVAHGQTGEEILKATGVQGGLVVHLGCGDGRSTASVRANQRYLVHGLTTNADDVAKARET